MIIEHTLGYETQDKLRDATQAHIHVFDNVRASMGNNLSAACNVTSRGLYGQRAELEPALVDRPG